MPKPVEKRGRGRPRTRPDGATERKWWATDAEVERLQREAIRAGVSVQELVRRRALNHS